MNSNKNNKNGGKSIIREEVIRYSSDQNRRRNPPSLVNQSRTTTTQVVQPKKKARRSVQRKKNFSQSSAPIVSTSTFSGTTARITHDNGKTVISNCELIDQIVAQNNTLYQITEQYRYRCNPASAKAFNWLSKIAVNFENFKFKKLSFIFRTRLPTTATGSIAAAPDYDAQDGIPTAEKLLLQMPGSIEVAPWKDFEIRLDPSLMNTAYKSHFTMSDGRFDTTTQDEKTIDPAQIFIGYDNIGGAVPLTWGKLFVDYVVELWKPQPAELDIDNGGLRLTSTNNQLSAQPMLTAPTIAQNGQDRVLIPWNERFPAAYPTNNMGIFAKDYEGLFEQLFQGATALTNITAPIITANNGVPGTVTNKITTIANASGTTGLNTYWIKALAGDYLAVGQPIAGTFSPGNLQVFLGGSGNY